MEIYALPLSLSTVVDFEAGVTLRLSWRGRKVGAAARRDAVRIDVKPDKFGHDGPF